MEHQPNSENSVGPLVGIIIIVLILALGGLYFWGEKLKEGRSAKRTQTETTQTASSTQETGDKVDTQTIPEYQP